MGPPEVATYSYIDLRDGRRLHKWGDGDSAKYAIDDNGYETVEDITEREAINLLKSDSGLSNSTLSLGRTEKSLGRRTEK